MDSLEPPAPVSLPSAQVVGNAFVHQYYNILYQSPGLVYRFYQEGSKLGRPEPQGMMSSVTTLQAVNEKILSLDYGGLRAEIKTVDAQESLNGAVLVLVTGYLTGKDNVRRNFTQCFFLATQDKGFFVLNDIFRYVEEAIQQQGNLEMANDTLCHSVEHETPQPLEEQVPEQQELPPEEVNVIEEACSPSEQEEGLVVEEEIPEKEMVDEVPHGSQAMAADSGYTNIQEEAPKKSYASIVKVMKENVAPSLVQAPASSRAVPSNLERQTVVAPSRSPVLGHPSASSNNPETIDVQESGVDGHSVYIKGLPQNATPDDLEEEFKRFGSIKPGGVQVRSHKQQGFCFGFIEFVAASSVQSAIEASPVTIGCCQASVEEKRPAGSRVIEVAEHWFIMLNKAPSLLHTLTSFKQESVYGDQLVQKYICVLKNRVRILQQIEHKYNHRQVGSRGRFSGRGGFRNEGMRGRGYFGGGRAYGRGDFLSKTEFGGRGGGRGRWSSRGDSTAVYKRVEHAGPTGGHGRSGSNASGASRNLASQTST